MEIDVISQGFNLMILGMGFVFIFLGVMVIVVELTIKLISIYTKHFPDTKSAETYATEPIKSDDSSVIAAITAALFASRKQIGVNNG